MPETDLALLVEAAEAAGRLALQYRSGVPETWDKPGGEGPVSEADLAIDRMLRGELTSARPDYGWLSEESAASPARLAAERVFIVDPIDGTRGFLGGARTFAHSLAVAEHGRIVAAVVFLPCRQRLYTAAAGEGAACDRAPLAVSRRGRLAGAHVLARRAHLAPRQWPGGVPEVTRHHRAPLSYRLALVAEGRFDAMITLRETWEWDVAAGTLLVAEAGGTVTDRHGVPLSFNAPSARQPGVMAAGATIYAALMRRRT